MPIGVRVIHEDVKVFMVVEVKEGKFKEFLRQYNKEMLLYAET